MARRRGALRAAALLPALALAVAAAGCAQPTGGGGGGDAAGGPVELIAPGKLTTCTHLPYEPFQFPKDGKIVGFDVDLVDLVARDLGVQQNIVDAPFDEGIQSGESLNSNQCDVAAAAMTITDVRKQNLDFSDPYFDAEQALLVKKDSGITDLAQMRGKKLGVQVGTTGQEYAEKNKDQFGYEVVVFDDLALQETAVQTGQVNAAINDNGVLLNFSKNNPDTQVTTEFATGDKYGIGVRKGNTALLQKVNESLKKAKESGEYDAIYQKWFGKKPE
ncbi:basic amino acid ABC transporter substrate-binding protein [Saccharopolyspora sp. WRP15-2]|uniref:Basic amino acid ABC transporter substrate-binding protein n=2 Tax=Saccharopolyspora TaxID=1835 RepID=A0ABT4V1G9_9PSEU|nr:basic amino acid ABC transporter substrate-binding protein [Saccharopolyspora oryzae]MDA3627785.1 basic amino acid ABC transporter substrate-binding protein [Saccharopolyspora oryzae]